MFITKTLFLILFLLAQSHLFSNNPQTDSLERLLPGSSIGERLEICLKLAEAYSNVNADTSIYYCHLALALSDTLRDDFAKANACYSLSRALNITGQFEEAINYVKKAEVLYRKLGKHMKYIASINQLGLIYQKDNNLEMAIGFFQKALQETLKLQENDPGNDTLRNNILTFKINIGLVYILQESYDTAKAYYENLLKEINNNDKDNLKIVLGNLAYIYNKTGEYEKALSKAEQMLDVNRELNNRNMEARSLMVIGNIYYYQGDYQKALEYYKMVFGINLEVGNKFTGARCANNIAAVYQKLGDHENAIHYFYESLKLKEELGDLNGMAMTYGNIGIVYHDWGNQEKALEYYFESLRINKEAGNKASIAEQYSNIGTIFNELHQPDSALHYYDKAIIYIDSIGDIPQKVGALTGIGAVYAESIRNYGKAIRYYLEALTLAEEIKSEFWVASCNVNLGKAYYENGSFSIAVQYLNKALAYGQESKTYDILTEANLYLSKVYEVTGLPLKSLTHYKAYTLVKDSIFNEEKAQIVSELQTKYETEKKEKDNLALRKDNEIQQLKLDNQKTAIYSMSAGIIIAILLLTLVYISYRKRTIAYKNLVSKNLELAQHDRKIMESGEFIPDSVKEKISGESDGEIELELIDKFNKYLSEEKPYLFGNISLEDVSARMGTNRTYLSKAINTVYNKSFNALINELRIREARQLLIDKKYDHISVEGIGEMVGYNSRIVFYNNFKKLTGLTPSYFKSSVS